MKRILGNSLLLPLWVTLSCTTGNGGGSGAGANGNNDGDNAGTGSTSSSNMGGGYHDNTSGGSGGVSTAPPDVDAACAADSTPAQLTRVNILFLLDKSGSMGNDVGPNAAQRWNPVVTTLDSFFSDQKSVGIYASLSFLPADGDIYSACAVASYSSGTSSIKVPLTLLDATGRQTFLSRLCDPSLPQTPPCIVPAGGTPTLSALQGTIQYAAKVAQLNPGSKTVIVFLTDGEPGFGYSYNGAVQLLYSCADLPPKGCTATCGGCVDGVGCTSGDAEVAKVSAVIGTAAAVIGTAPANPIYLFGVGDLTASTMDQWASASGNAAVALQGLSGAQAASTLKAALEAIRTSSISCNLDIPVPKGGGSADINQVNVSYINGAGNRVPVGKDVGCTHTQQYGWQYDNPTSPTKIQLCTSTCTMAQQDPNGKIQVLLGCPTNPIN